MFRLLITVLGVIDLLRFVNNIIKEVDEEEKEKDKSKTTDKEDKP